MLQFYNRRKHSQTRQLTNNFGYLLYIKKKMGSFKRPFLIYRVNAASWNDMTAQGMLA